MLNALRYFFNATMSTPVSTPAKRVSYSPLRRNTTTVKTSLDSPFRFKWPTVTHQNCEDIITALKSALHDVRPPSRKEKKQGKEVYFNKEKRSFLIIGVNAVLRNMEKGVVKFGLLCSSTQPTLLHQHFLTMAGNKGVPFGIIPELNTVLCPLLGVKSALAIGIKECDLVEENFIKLIDTLLKLLKVPYLPWMSPSVTQQGAVCITPKTPTTSVTQADVDGNNGRAPSNRNTDTELTSRNIKETPKNASNDAATPRSIPSNEEIPRCTVTGEPIPGDTSKKVVTSKNTFSKEDTSTSNNFSLVTKRKRRQPSYHGLNVKRMKVTVNSKIKKKK